MLKTRALVIVAVLATIFVVVVFMLTWRPKPVEANRIDLVEMFPEAEKRTDVESLEQAFAVTDLTVGGQSRRVILAHPSSRIIWPVVIPPNAVLTTSFGLRPEAWDKDGDGVQFRVGISDGRTYNELLCQYVDPRDRPADRRWYTVNLDLSPYQGRSVHVVFNTDPGPRGDWNTAWDHAGWGDPRIYSTR